MSSKKKIAILGSTGSVGIQTLEVLQACDERFQVTVLSANNNATLLVQQAIAFKPRAVILGNKSKIPFVRKMLKDQPVNVYESLESLNDIGKVAEFDMLVNAASGISSLQATLNAIKDGKNIVMANKEVMVAAGVLIMEAARVYEASIIPVDSEHSAIFQCLRGESPKSIEKIFLTASGGPFRGKKREELFLVKVEDALRHPNWKMGKKISIDSATMANKGMEAIAAQWYFDVRPDQISIILHPQSIIHSLVQFTDGSLKAQLAIPDMRIPIHYAVHYPERQPAEAPTPDFSKGFSLSFEEIDINNYPDLKLALEAMNRGGNMPAAFSAANEVAVHAFLNKEIKFTQIADISKKVLKQATMIPKPNLHDILATDAKCRKIANMHIKTIQTFNR